MKQFSLFIILLFVSLGMMAQQMQLTTQSQKASKLFEAALRLYNQRAYANASELLEKALKEDPNFVDALFMLSQVHEDSRNDSLAIVYCKKAIDIKPDYFPPAYMNLARLEHQNSKYADALVHIDKYLSYPAEVIQSKNEAQLLRQSILFAQNAIRHPVQFQPKDLGPEVNSKYNEYWPRLSADEQTLVFTKLLPKDNLAPYKFPNTQEDFFSSTYENSEWTSAKPLGAPLNTRENEGAQTISADGKLIIFTRCASGSLCDLFYSRKEGDNWLPAQSIGETINTRASEKQPSLSPDGKDLYYVSNRIEGKGGFDIWKSTLNEEGVWGAPEDLGDSINTPYDEFSPFIHQDNQTMYFSSNGWPGMGRLDIFMSRLKSDGQWTTPKNLGYPINSNFEEIGLIVNARSNLAYFSSNRMGTGLGGDDIYSFELYKEVRPKPASYMKGNVFDQETNTPLAARFELIDLGTAKNVMDAKANADGTFLICIPSGKNYALNVSRKGYLFYSDNFTMSDGDFTKPFVKDVPLKPIKVGEKVVMRNIFFEIEKFELKSESKVELDKLIVLMKSNPNLQIEIGGHTDNTGKADYNLKLSESRAKAVSDYLTQSGITATRISAKGYGSSQPLADNATDDGRAKNRRTEFTVTGK